MRDPARRLGEAQPDPFDIGPGRHPRSVRPEAWVLPGSLERHLVAQHPWDKPEVVAVPLVEGSTPFLRWPTDSTESPAP